MERGSSEIECGPGGGGCDRVSTNEDRAGSEQDRGSLRISGFALKDGHHAVVWLPGVGKVKRGLPEVGSCNDRPQSGRKVDGAVPSLPGETSSE